MSASTERRKRKVGHGGVCDTIPDGAKINVVFTLDGVRYAELTDGRIARMPVPKLEFSIRDGKLIRF